MRSFVCTRWGPPSALSLQETDVPPPPPGKGEVAIAVHACAVNFPDVLIVQARLSRLRRAAAGLWCDHFKYPQC